MSAAGITVHAATACFPGLSVHDAIAAIQAGASEPLIGTLSSEHVQLCPQSGGHLDERTCEDLRHAHPQTRFRLHANARVLSRHVRYDASNFNADTRFYYEALADRSRRLGASGYSIHAGYRRNCDLATMLDNMRRIQDIFGDIPVAVEGLYPHDRLPQLMDSWDEYFTALHAGIPLAVDLSHLKIVERAQASADTRLLIELLRAPTTMEVHLSDNDGRSDRHDVLAREPFWWACRHHINPDAVIFSEGNQIRACGRRQRQHSERPTTSTTTKEHHS